MAESGILSSEFMPPIVATLVLDAMEFSKGVDEAVVKAEGMKGRMLAASKAIAAGFIMVGSAIIAHSVSVAAAWDNSMLRLRTQAKASTAEVENMSKAVLKLAPAVGASPNALASALYHIESAGIHGKNALDMLTASAKLSAIGQSDLEATTNALIAIIQSGIGGVHGMTDAASLMNTTVGLGNMKMQELTGAITTGVLPAARAVGLQFSDVGSALDIMTRSGVPAEAAAMRLRMTFALMASPSSAAVKSLKTIGITSKEIANDMRQPNGLLVALDDLQAHLAKAFDLNTKAGRSAATNVVLSSFGKARSGSTIEMLLQQLPQLTRVTEQFGTPAQRAKDFTEAWAEQNKEFEQRINDLKASLEVLEIRIGNFFIPLIEKVIKATIEVIHWFDKHKLAADALSGAIKGGLVVALALATAGLYSFTAAILANPITLVTVSIEALSVAVYELYKHWDGFYNAVMHNNWTKALAGFVASFVALVAWPVLVTVALVGFAKNWHDVWTSVAAFFGGITTDILGYFKTLVDAMFATVEGILQAGSHLPFVGHYFKDAKNSVEDMRRGFDEQITGMIGDIKSLIKQITAVPPMKRVTFSSTGVPNVVQDISRINSALDKIGSSYVVSVGGTGRKLIASTGALVPGGYGGGDIVPAMLEPGEAVVPKHLVGAIAPFLAANRVPGFALGGLVSDTTVKVDTMAIGNSLFSGYGGIFSGAGGGNGFAGGATSSGANVALGAQLAASLYGWVGAMFDALNKLWTRESGWNAYAVNPSSGAAGIPQALGHGNVFALGDAYSQILWGLSYIAQRYGNPINAWAHEVSSGWYDRGGWLQPGWTMAYNGTGKAERIRTAEQEAALGGGLTINLYAWTVDRNSIYQLADLVLTGISRKKARGDRLPTNLSI